jgi:hypothetical protein
MSEEDRQSPALNWNRESVGLHFTQATVRRLVSKTNREVQPVQLSPGFVCSLETQVR